ncbi:MBL fold metallo-hydrolase [Tritonibacter multivorans]|nr:MBL fold metallo-hydrolase [Tritonibacter multivorans]MDA7419452.1 MBL fold metallo-hydrolase [Tritonibacter multivorans]
MRVLISFLLMVWALPVGAQDRRASHCIALVENTPGIEMIHTASWQDPLTDEFTVRLHYIAHASFLLQTAGGLSVVTDYTGFLGSTDLVPDVVTMNHAHSTHWTERPDPRIPHVLPGWGDFGVGIDHHLDLGEMLVRNVSTDIRSSFSGVEANGNSIFVFEVAGLCIGHLGHLHHVPTPEQFAALGRLDVVMAAVDGGTTLPLPDMIKVLERLRSSIVIPMHWFSGQALERFLTEIGNDFPIQRVGRPSVEISLRDLPSRPTVVVLTPAYLTAAQ